MKNSPRSRRGFTLAELLVAMVIASMASAVVARSLAFALQFYQARTGDTEAQLLCETVSLLVQNDLATHAYGARSNDDYKSDSDDGYGMAPQIPKTPATGEVGVTLPKSCYGFGDTDAMSRKVKITVTPDNAAKRYGVTVEVKSTVSGTMTARNEFSVVPVGV